MRLISTAIYLLLLSGLHLGAQISQPGVPRSVSLSLKAELLVFSPPKPDVERLKAEDLISDTLKDIPWRFGENIEVSMNPENWGRWDYLPGEGKIWRLPIHSPGAYSLNLTFDRYKLPPGAELYIYSKDLQHILGAFTDYNNQEDGWFATTLIPSDEIIIEYFEPEDSPFAGELNLQMITHAYRNPWLYTKAFGDSGLCNLNVACPESEGWEQQIRSVVMLITGGNGFCSGALINNAEFDATPLVLSANHCYRTPSTVVFWFNWQSETCANPSTSPPYNAMSGAQQIARNAASDFWLMELNQPVPEAYKPYFAGWNRTLEATLNETITGVHHPRGDIKKFSYSLSGIDASDYGGTPGSGTTHWRIIWSGGTTTEGGSSGSPIFDAAGRIIGQLHGGGAACGNTLPDWYGRLGISWEGGGTSDTRLKDRLDPGNTGLSAINGFDPLGPRTNPPLSFSAQQESAESILLSWETNIDNNPVIIAYSTNQSFGQPIGPLALGDTLPAGGVVVYIGYDTEYTHYGLSSQTRYNYQIRSYAYPGPEYSIPLNAYAVTSCETVKIYPFAEGFNSSNLSSCWQQEFVSQQLEWQTGVGNNDGHPDNTYEGSENVYFRALVIPEMGSTTRLISPVFDLSAYNHASLSFKYANPSYLDNQDVLKVLFRSSPDGEWEVLRSFDHDQFSWIQAWIDLPEISPKVQIAFEGTANRGRGISLDLVEILPSFGVDLPTPVNLEVSIIDNSFAQLNWELLFDDKENLIGAGINVYRDDELIFEGNDLSVTSYSDGPLAVGTYNWHLRTRLPDGTLSQPGNTVEAVVWPGQNTATLTLSSGGPGDTKPGSGTWIYNTPAEVSIRAIPDLYANFSEWIVNGNVYANHESITLVVDQDKTVEAVFTPEIIEISLKPIPEEAAADLQGAGTHIRGESIELSTVPAPGYIFLHWQEDENILSTRPQTSLTPVRDMQIIAMFEPREFIVDIIIQPEEAGTVTGAGVYGANTVISVVAEPNDGWGFTGWLQIITGEKIPLTDQSQYSFMLESDITLLALFEPLIFTLEVAIQGEGTISPSPGSYTFWYAQQISLQAEAVKNWKFMHWEINGQELKNSSLDYEIRENTLATAIFQDATNTTVNATEMLKIFPQPATDLLKIRLPATGTWEVQLFDLGGRLMSANTFEQTKGEVIELNVATLQSGVYILRIENNNSLHHARVIVN